MKKIIALLLVLCMGLGLMTACGDKDKKDNKPSITKGDMFDMLEAMGNATSGTSKMTFDIDIPESGVKGQIVLGCAGDATKNSCAFDFTIKGDFNGQAVDFSLKNAIVSDGSDLYINLPECVNALGAYSKDLADMIDTSKLGWIRFPIPDDLPRISEKFQKRMVGTMVGLFEKMLKETEKKGQDGDYTVQLTGKKDVLQMLTALRDFVKSDLKGMVNEAVQETSGYSIDLNKYVQKLIDTYQPEISEVCKAYGADYGFNEDMVNAYIDQIKQMDLNKQLEEYKQQASELENKVVTDEQIDELVKKLDQALTKLEAAEDKDLVAEGADISLRVFADDNYHAVAKMAVKDKGSISLTLDMDPTAPSISAPTKDTMTLKDIADIAIPLAAIGPVGPGPEPTPMPVITDEPTPAPTEAPVATPTPTPTEAPAEPTPTEVPAEPTPTEVPAEPTPTEAPADPTPTVEPAGNVETDYANGKGVIALGNGKALTFDLPGSYSVMTKDTNQLGLMTSSFDIVAITTEQTNGMSIDDYVKAYEQLGETLTPLGDIGAWKAYQMNMQGMTMDVALTNVGDTLVCVVSYGSEDLLNNVLGSISNMEVK